METGGSIVVAGQFSQPRANIFRVNANGNFDIAFPPGGANGDVLDLARQAASKIIAVGEFRPSARYPRGYSPLQLRAVQGRNTVRFRWRR